MVDINETIKRAKIKKRVRKGCSPYLFNIFIEASIDELKNRTRGIKINGHRVHNI